MILKRAAPADSGRHATLQLALDWSHHLLTATEQILFRRMSVFVSPCDLDALKAVCAQDADAWNVLDPLTGLIAKSLVESDTTGIRARYAMIETVRLYAHGRLEAAGEAAAIRRRHAIWFLGVAESAEPRLTGSDQAVALDDLAAHYDDLRGALRWSIGESQFEVAVRLAGALTLFWRIRGHYREGHDFHAAAVNLGGDMPAGMFAKALWGHGFMALMRDATEYDGGAGPSHEETRGMLEASLSVAEQTEDRVGQARALLLLGNYAYCVRDGQRARELLQRSASLAAEASDPWCWSHALGMEARIHLDDGDVGAARPLVDRCLALGRHARDLQGTRLGLSLLGELEVAVGNYRAAESAIEGALAIGRRLREPYLVNGCLTMLAEIRAATGDRGAAGALVEEALHARPHLSLHAILNLGNLALDRGDLVAAKGWFDILCEALDSDGKPRFCGVAGLGSVAASEGREDEARSLLVRARVLAGVRADRDRTIAALTASLGRIARDRGDRSRAVSLHCQALEIYQDAGFAPGVVQSLEDLGALRGEAGAAEHAARLLGAAHALREDRSYARAPVLTARHEADIAAVRAALGHAGFEAAWADGGKLGIAEAAAHALKGWGARPRSASGWDSLTRAELEVVALVREGLTNRQIAERLFVSPRTVGGHLAHIFGKLGLHSRAKLAVDAGHHCSEGAQPRNSGH